MLGVERYRQNNRRLTSLCSRPPLLEAAGLRWRGSSARLFCPEPASRSGFSLSHDDRPFLSGHYGVPVPDLPLQHLAEPFSGPFGLRLLADPVCPAPAISIPPTRYPIPVQQSRVRLGSPLPLRGFASPIPDPCVRSDLLPGSSPSETARSPVPLRSRYACCGSWLQVRYRLGGLLFLEPLGTTFIFLLIKGKVNRLLKSENATRKNRGPRSSEIRAKLFVLRPLGDIGARREFNPQSADATACALRAACPCEPRPPSCVRHPDSLPGRFPNSPHTTRSVASDLYSGRPGTPRPGMRTEAGIRNGAHIGGIRIHRSA